MDSAWFFMLVAGSLVGICLGVPRVYVGNVVFEPRHDVELTTWAFIPLIALSLFVLHRSDILLMRWTPFLIGLIAARAPIVLLMNRAIDKGLLPEALLRIFYMLKLYKPRPDEPVLSPDFVRHAISQQDSFFDGRSYSAICARLSWEAYQDEASVTECATAWGLSGKRIASGHLSFIELHDSKSIFFAFTGTDELADWKHNLDAFVAAEVEWGRVHAGFNKAADSIWPDVTAAIRATGISNPEIWLTGHSLGGALAVVSSMKLVLSDIDGPAGIVTFGQPAVGNLAFCTEFDRNFGSRSLRFVNCADEVPNQPPGYLHAGKLMYFDRKGRLHDQPGGFRIWIDQMLREERGPFEDHSMLQYLRLVEWGLAYGVGAVEWLDQELWEVRRRVKSEERNARLQNQ